LSDKKQILKSASVITLVTIISRILGYVRDQRITLLLGTSLIADSFFLAYRIPNLLRRLVAEGSMTASFIPVFTSYLTEKPREEVWDFANRLFWTLAVILVAITLLGMYFSPGLVHLFTLLESRHAQWDKAVELNRLLFPYILFIGLAALAMAILNCFHVFALPASTPIVLNICTIAASFWVIWSKYGDPATALAVGVLLGGALQFLVQVPELLKRGMTFRFGVSFTHPGIRSVARLMVPGFFGIGIYQVNLVVSTIFATSEKMPPGSLTSIYVADRVNELVLGGYAIAVATAILPMMAHQAAAHDFEALKKTFAFALRIVSFITIPAMVGLVVLREPIINVLFQHGEFGAMSTTLTARALLYSALGLPAFAAVKLIVPAFYSTKDTRTPVKIAFYAAAANILLNYIFMKTFYQTLLNGGPAFATSLAAYFNFFVLFYVFRRRFGRLGTLEILASLGKVLVCSVAMGSLCYLALQFLHFSEVASFGARLLWLVLLITISTAAYVGLAWALRCPEVEEVYGIATAPRQRGEAVGVPYDGGITE
jgi:putative peptidoglycan lipid II flippase